jgi:hypothetical protein
MNIYFDNYLISMFRLEQIIYTGSGGIRRTIALLEQKQQVAIK